MRAWLLHELCHNCPGVRSRSATEVFVEQPNFKISELCNIFSRSRYFLTGWLIFRFDQTALRWPSSSSWKLKMEGTFTLNERWRWSQSSVEKMFLPLFHAVLVILQTSRHIVACHGVGAHIQWALCSGRKLSTVDMMINCGSKNLIHPLWMWFIQPLRFLWKIPNCIKNSYGLFPRYILGLGWSNVKHCKLWHEFYDPPS